MSVNGVGVNPNVNYPQTEQRKTGGTSRALQSALLAGTGQFKDGRNKAGALFLGSWGASLLGAAGAAKCVLTATKDFSLIQKLGITGLYALPILIWLVNIADAYKGEKTQKAENTTNNNAVNPNFNTVV